MQKTLVFGASLKSERYSNLVIQKLVSNGIPTEAYGLKEGQVYGIQIKTNLDELTNIDVVTLYLNPERQKEYYQCIIDLRPNKVIFNPGTENPEFYELLKKSDIEVQEACSLVLLATGQY